MPYIYYKSLVKGEVTCIYLFINLMFIHSVKLMLRFSQSSFLILSFYTCVCVEPSKIDRYTDGLRLVITRTNTEVCPVDNLDRYTVWAVIAPDSDAYIYCNVNATKLVVNRVQFLAIFLQSV